MGGILLKGKFVFVEIERYSVSIALCASKTQILKTVYAELSSQAYDALYLSDASALEDVFRGAYRKLNADVRSISISLRTDRAHLSDQAEHRAMETLKTCFVGMGFQIRKLQKSRDKVSDLAERGRHRVAEVCVERDVCILRVYEHGVPVSEREYDFGMRPVLDVLSALIPEYGNGEYDVLSNIRLGKLWELRNSAAFDKTEFEESEYVMLERLHSSFDAVMRSLNAVKASFGSEEEKDKGTLILIGGALALVPGITETIEGRMGVETMSKMSSAYIGDADQNVVSKIWTGYLPVAFLLLLIGIITVFTVNQMQREDGLQKELARIEASIAESERKEPERTLQENEKAHRRLSEFASDFSYVSEMRSYMSEDVIRKINKQIPENVYLRLVEFNGNRVSVSGVSADHADYSQFAYNLRDASIFKDIQLGTILSVQNGYQFIITFTIDMGEENEK